MDSKNTVLEEAKDINSYAEELILSKNTPINCNKVFILLEGPDDLKFYSPFFDEEKSVLYYRNGCESLVKQLTQLKDNPLFTNSLIGIKDSDFDKLLGKSNPIDNLFLTDYHDWEIMSCTDAMEKRLHVEYKIPNNISIINDVMIDIVNLSFIRLANDINVRSGTWSDGISFIRIDYPNIYDGKNPVDLSNCLTRIHNSCKNNALPKFPTADDINELKSHYPDYEIKQITQGHDFMHALQHKLKINYKCKESVEALSKIFRSGYNNEHFKNTHLYHDLNNWMSTNNKVLWAS